MRAPSNLRPQNRHGMRPNVSFPPLPSPPNCASGECANSSPNDECGAEDPKPSEVSKPPLPPKPWFGERNDVLDVVPAYPALALRWCCCACFCALAAAFFLCLRAAAHFFKCSGISMRRNSQLQYEHGMCIICCFFKHCGLWIFRLAGKKAFPHMSQITARRCMMVGSLAFSRRILTTKSFSSSPA